MFLLSLLHLKTEHFQLWSKYHMWKGLENPQFFIENGPCLLQPCSCQCLVSSLGITDLSEIGTVSGNHHNWINSKWNGESQQNYWKIMGEKCLDSLPEKSIKKYSPSNQLFLYLSSAAHNFFNCPWKLSNHPLEQMLLPCCYDFLNS